MINFPYTNFHRLNLDAIIKKIEVLEATVKKVVGSVEKIPTKLSQLVNDMGFINTAQAIAAAPVKSVNGKTGDISLDASDVGALPDSYTPPQEIFWATYGVTTNAEIENALDNGMLPCVHGSTGEFYCVFSRRQSATTHFFAGAYITSTGNKYMVGMRCNNGTWTQTSALVAAIASPTFTGTPAAPTATSGDNSTQIATTAFVHSEINNAALISPTFSNVNSKITLVQEYVAKNNQIYSIRVSFHVTAAVSNNEVLFTVNIPQPIVGGAYWVRSASNGNFAGVNFQAISSSDHSLKVTSAGAIATGEWYGLAVTYIGDPAAI